MTDDHDLDEPDADPDRVLDEPDAAGPDSELDEPDDARDSELDEPDDADPDRELDEPDASRRVRDSRAREAEIRDDTPLIVRLPRFRIFRAVLFNERQAFFSPFLMRRATPGACRFT